MMYLLEIFTAVKHDAEHMLRVCWAVVSSEHVQCSVDLVNQTGPLNLDDPKVSEIHHHMCFPMTGMLHSRKCCPCQCSYSSNDQYTVSPGPGKSTGCCYEAVLLPVYLERIFQSVWVCFYSTWEVAAKLAKCEVSAQ